MRPNASPTDFDDGLESTFECENSKSFDDDDDDDVNDDDGIEKKTRCRAKTQRRNRRPLLEPKPGDDATLRTVRISPT